MTFRRTPLGLKNLHLFVGVDLIVFTEGGPRTISKKDAYSGDFEPSAIDISFWRQLFARIRSDLNVEFRALGSKSTLKEIAHDILHGRTSRVCVTMDRDYDCHFSDMIDSPNVIYSRCYSWENEIFNASVVEDVFYQITQVNQNTVRVKQEIRSIMKRALSDLHWLTYADALLCLGGSSLFDRKKLEGTVTAGTEPPCIRRDRLLSELRAKKANVGKFRLMDKSIQISSNKDCCGKILLIMAYRIIFYLINKHTSLPSLPKQYAYVLLIRGFSDWLMTHPRSAISRYYIGRLSRVTV